MSIIKYQLITMLLTCQIIISNASHRVVLSEVLSVKIKKGFSNLCNTADVVFPKNIAFTSQNEQKLTEIIKHGSKITIALGYDNNNEMEFEGYVTQIQQTIPIRLSCEDEIYVLKRKTLKPKTFDNANLEDIVKYCTDGLGYQLEVTNGTVGKFNIEGSNVTAAKVLQYLKEKYGYSSYFVSAKKLMVGFPFQITPTNQVFVLDFGFNIKKNNLTYKSKDEVNITLKGISHRKGKEPVKVEYNPKQLIDGDGESRTIHCNSNLSEAQILEQLKIEYERVQVDGYTGTITHFGVPNLQTGDAVVFRDADFIDRKGKYLISDVDIDFGHSGGYSRTISITKKI